MENDFLGKLGHKDITKAQLLQIVESNFGLVPDLLRAQTSNATDRYGCGKVLMDLSEKHPDMIYPYMDSFIELLDSEHDSKVECDCNNGKPNESCRRPKV